MHPTGIPDAARDMIDPKQTDQLADIGVLAPAAFRPQQVKCHIRSEGGCLRRQREPPAVVATSCRDLCTVSRNSSLHRQCRTRMIVPNGVLIRAAGGMIDSLCLPAWQMPLHAYSAAARLNEVGWW